MAEKLRQSSGSTTTGAIAATTGTGTTETAQVAYGCPQPGPETIEVEQVLGAGSAQQVVEADMLVPDQKPDIEQVIDVYVKDVQITSVDVITDRVIVRGDLAVKVMYVAALPNQPVHAFEKSHIRWTQYIDIPGAQAGMNAKADVNVEFVGYEFDENTARQVHFTIVLKVWTRVVTTASMDVYAMTPVDQLGQTEVSNATQSAGEMPSTPPYGGSYEQNVVVSGPIGAPSAGTSMQTSGTATVTGTNVNVRTGPGTNFPIVTKVNKGDMVSLTDQAFGWYRVTLQDGTDGWIASWLLSAGAGAAPPKG